MNPDQVKRREHLGLTFVLGGLLAGLAGIICLLFLLPLGLSILGLGTALCTAGVLVLMRIPDLVGTTFVGSAEDAW